MHWLILQLADSAFPAGGFVHSSGLEAALHLGEVDAQRFPGYLRDALWQAGRASLPLASEAHDAPESLPRLDALCDAFLSNHVANRASRQQGRAFLYACQRSFPVLETQWLRDAACQSGLCQHFAPVFGAVLKLLDVELPAAQRMWLFISARSSISAAVRLGIVGPHRAQQLQFELAPVLEEVHEQCASLRSQDLAQTAPPIDLFQSLHDRLYSRLFQS